MMQQHKRYNPVVKRLTCCFAAVCVAAVTLASYVAAQAGGATALPVDFERLEPGTYAPNELIVGVDSRFPLPQTARALARMGVIADGIPALGAYRVVLSPHVALSEAAAYIATLPGVRYVEPNYYLEYQADPNDPDYPLQYAPQVIRANWVWDIWQPRRTVYVAVIDSGIDTEHPELRDKLRRRSDGRVYGWNVTNNTDDVRDMNGHGTKMAGIIAARINNGIGIAGIAGWNPANASAQQYVQLMPVKIDASTSPTAMHLAQGILWAAGNGAHILCIGEAMPNDSSVVSQAVQQAANRGCLLIAPAGNRASDRQNYPAAYNAVMAVAATDRTDTLWSNSSYGSWVEIAAPGHQILTTDRNGRYETRFSGTSAAAAHVAGAAALLWSHFDHLTSNQVRTALRQHIDQYTPYRGRTIASGAGRLNVYRAMMALMCVPIQSVQVEPTRWYTDHRNQRRALSGDGIQVTVQLQSPAPYTMTIQLRSSHTSVVGNATLVIPAGQTSGSVTLSSRRSSQNINLRITAVNNCSEVQSNALRLHNTLIHRFRVNPSEQRVGRQFQFTIELPSPAPSGGYQYNIWHNGGESIRLPSSRRIAEGRTSDTFSAEARRAHSGFTVRITGANGEVYEVRVRINR